VVVLKDLERAADENSRCHADSVEVLLNPIQQLRREISHNERNANTTAHAEENRQTPGQGPESALGSRQANLPRPSAAMQPV
jgi:hypothetical protein